MSTVPHPVATFESVVEFWRAKPARERSPELDFGVHWRAQDVPWPTWRISYIDLTGELYCVLNTGGERNRVEVLGVFPLRPCPACVGKGGHTTACHACGGTGNSRQPVDAALAGWADVCGENGSLEWARRRAAGQRVPVPAFVREHEEEEEGLLS